VDSPQELLAVQGLGNGDATASELVSLWTMRNSRDCGGSGSISTGNAFVLRLIQSRHKPIVFRSGCDPTSDKGLRVAYLALGVRNNPFFYFKPFWPQRLGPTQGILGNGSRDRCDISVLVAWVPLGHDAHRA